MKNILLFALLIIGMIACAQKTEPIVAADGTKFYGEEFDHKTYETYDEFLAKMETEEEVETTIIGYVESVCQAKGCWMNITPDGDPEGAATFVKFKDYGFFMPKDLAGQKVIMHGKGYKELTPVDELRHYAEDAGESQEVIDAITEPKEELKFMADGVVIVLK